MLTLNIFHTFTVSIVDIEQVNVSWALFITQDKRRNKRNLLHCLNSTFKLYVTCKGIKHQVWKVWFVYYTFTQVFNNAEVYWNKRKKNVIEISSKTICVWRVKFIWRKHVGVYVWKNKRAFFIHFQEPKMFCRKFGEEVKEIGNFCGKCGEKQQQKQSLRKKKLKRYL